jgi:hypothetical protein
MPFLGRRKLSIRVQGKTQNGYETVCFLVSTSSFSPLMITLYSLLSLKLMYSALNLRSLQFWQAAHLAGVSIPSLSPHKVNELELF